MIRMEGIIGTGSFQLAVSIETAARVLGIWGPSGSGKTTLLQTIAGLSPLRSGSLTLLGEALEAPGTRCPPHRRPIGLVFQDHRLFPHLSAKENLLFGYRRTPPEQRRVRPDRIIDLLQLAPFLHQPIRHCSGGEQKRIALGRTLLRSPSLLLLDEPCTGLDPHLKAATLAMLNAAVKALDLRMILVSHDRSELLALAEAVAEIRDGQARLLPSPSALLQTEHGTEPLMNYLPGTVVHQSPSGMASVQLDHGPVLHGIGHQVSPGQPAMVSLAAHDLLLFRDPPPANSARNSFPATLETIDNTPHAALITLQAGVPLRAEVTREAANELKLATGQTLHLLLKARSVHVYPARG